MKRIFYNSKAEAVRTGEQIGAGGEGVVYEVLGRSDLAAKIYYERLSSEKAEKLLALSQLGSERLFRLSAWPMDVLRSEPDGDVIGFVMKRINDGREVHTLHSPRSRLQAFPEASWAFLIYVAANVVRAITTVHDHGFVIGDVNPKNILVTRRATVFLLDCDSFQVSTGGKSYRCEGGFPEYTPPELQGIAFGEVDREPEHDYFGLAVAVFQLLFLGRHPFSGCYLEAEEMPIERAIRERRFAYGADSEARLMKRPPGALALEAIPAPIAGLFRRAFLSMTAVERPRPQEWIELLESLAKSLQKCGLHSGHLYHQELSECPWCSIETGARIRLFNFSLNGVKRGHFKLDQVWKDISSINPPPPPPLVRSIPEEYFAPSPLGREAIRERTVDLALAIAVAVIGGFLIGLTTSSFLLMGLAVLGVIKLARGSDLLSLKFKKSKSLSPVAEKIQTAKNEADDKVRNLEKKWQEEASEERFINKFIELQNQKDTYEKIPQIRRFRLDSLEAKGNGVTHRARIAVEKEVDDLRHRLEYELSTGAFYLNRVRCEIEENRQRILPALLNEKQSLAQVTKDWEVATRENSLKLVIFLLFIAFFVGSGIGSWAGLGKRPQTSANSDVSGKYRSERPAPPPAQPVEDVSEGQRQVVNSPKQTTTKASKAVKNLYEQGARLVAAEKFGEAVDKLKRVVESDSQFHEAWQQLGFAYYRLGFIQESLAAAEKAVSITNSFGSYYTIGLVHVHQKQWAEAIGALSLAVTYCESNAWDYSYTYAYENLARSITERGVAKETIKLIEEGLKIKIDHYERFKLALLYNLTGDYLEASRQSHILRSENEKLADELDKALTLKIT
jgi:DNA-binding helix-hairpin-helix protein with protein kinase domain/Tfp pilus assembly protein PilF